MSPLPTGLKPQRLHDDERILDILDAMRRYICCGENVPATWIAELYNLLQNRTEITL